ncbi:MAG: hypothetical protein ACI8WT_003954 [Clostridium sp.]|jgi:hypothetical protein
MMITAGIGTGIAYVSTLVIAYNIRKKHFTKKK